jgi:uncharacterized protein
LRVVVDTNVFISSYLGTAAAPHLVFEAWRAGRYELLYSGSVLREYEGVLRRERIRRRHGMSDPEMAVEIGEIRRRGIPTEPESVDAVIHVDPSDDEFLACALAGGADYIVSGDAHLLSLREYRSVRILSPATFLLLLESDC